MNKKKKSAKEKSAGQWIFEWAGQHKSSYIFSVLTAIINVAFRIIPYFLIASILSMLVSGNRSWEAYVVRIVLIVASFLVAELFHSLSTGLSHRATFTVLANIKKDCCDKLARVPLGFVKDKSSGDLKNVIVERVDSMETTLAHMLPEYTSNLLAPIAVVIYFFVVDWRMALFAFIPMFLGVLSMMGMFHDYDANYKNTIEKVRALNEAAVEYINGIEVIKVFGKVDSSYEKFTRAARESADAFIHWMRENVLFQSTAFGLTPYTLLTVLPIGAIYVSNGSLTLSDFILCVILSMGIIGPILKVFSYTDDLAVVSTTIGQIAGVLEQPELNRPEKTVTMPENSEIVLRDVRFGYHEKEVLHNINMTFEPNTVSAIVGPSGSGKSTIAKLISAMWDVDSGSISVGGVNIKDIALEDYNRMVAYVSQENYLFNTSVMENIRQGRLDATDEEVREVAKKSGCYEFIMSLENGFDTIVGGAGGHLSGGERQRIAIARAMLKDAPIIILDEATAYTDPENEAIIQSSIARLVAGKTLIVIAHRLSTIQNCDKIYVISDGEVQEQGTHEQLLGENGLYKEMWDAHVSVRDSMEGGPVYA